MTDSSREKTVVLFSTADWGDRYWTNKQHTASLLAARGYRVLYVETVGIRKPSLNKLDFIRILSRLASGLAPIREVTKNVWVFSPLTIPLGHRYGLIRKFNGWQLQGRIRNWLRGRKAVRPIVWTYHPYMLGAMAMLDPHVVIYHAVDDLRAIPNVDREEFDHAEAALLARANHVFVTSPALLAHCSAIAAGRTHYYNNVADIAYFGQARLPQPLPSDLADIAEPRIMYVGALSDFKLDLDLLATMVEDKPDWNFVFIGDQREGQNDQRIARMALRSNAHFIGWRPYAELPRYLHGASVTLLPQQINDYTRSMFPMKFFEYLAAGRPVVATPLPALADFARFHRIAATAPDFIAAVADAIAHPEAGVLALDHPVLQENSWDARLDAMLEIVAHQPGGG